MNRVISQTRKAGFAALVFLALGGPSPGAVGSCSDDSGIADPVEFCINKKSWTCIREAARGDIPISDQARTQCADRTEGPQRQNCERETSKNICVSEAPNRCATAMWDVNCSPPNEIAADACIQALKSADRLGDATDSILECNPDVLCPPIDPASSGLESTEVTP